MSAQASIGGLYAVTPDNADTRVLVAQVEAAVRGGARVVQYRNKIAAPELRLEQAQALQALCARGGVPLIVNDDVEVARRVNAAGVHIGRDDGLVKAARAVLGPRKIIGVSCYNMLERAQAAENDGADYVAFGGFFRSTVKPGVVKSSLELLTQAKNLLRVPVVAIGGITVDNAVQLIAAGADAVAVITALFQSADIAAEAHRFAALFESAHDAQR